MTPLEAAAAFRKVADRIGRNAEDTFCGAFLVVPPEGDAVDGLSVATVPDIPGFWSGVSGQIAREIEGLQAAANGGSGRGRGYR